jgi:hypothetical protein
MLICQMSPFSMTAKEFNELDLGARIKALHNSVLITSVNKNLVYRIELYDLKNEFVEVWVNKLYQRIDYARIATYDDLDKFLKNLHLHY